MIAAIAPRYSVVIPFYNESAVARAFVEEVCAAMAGLEEPFEVLAVDDGSTDTTATELARAAAQWPQCRVVRQTPNAGQAAALLRGFAEARAPIIVTLDGDGQNVPADIPRLLPLLDQADMVVGVRAARHDSWLRRKMSRVANRVRARVLGDGLSDSGCALKVFRREVAAAFWPIRSLYSFMPAFAVAAGFRVTEIVVQHRERRGGVSNYGLRVMLWRPLADMLALWWLLRRRGVRRKVT
ncbi:MAG: glycosyltransferase family 2 protein [Opitutae bacterium]|nr:glycosyltransferase family 2 protein [Opitutae bacterium]